MLKAKMSAVIAVAIVASVAAGGLLLINGSSPYSSPEKSINAFIDAESRADLPAMEKPASKALFQNFIGRFGEAKFNEARSIYQRAYDIAEPKWREYRENARTAAIKEHESISEEINKLGRDAFAGLPADQRLQFTEDRARFNDFVFEQGLKALPSSQRSKIADPQAFRENRDLDQFTDREGFALLPEEDRRALKTSAALSGALTPERMAFLEGIGLPQLSDEQRQAVASIPSSELSNPQEFMQRYGQEPAREFLKTSALEAKITPLKCNYVAEDSFGSLFKGSSANCTFSINVRGAQYVLEAALVKEGGMWKIVSAFPTLQQIPEAYPPQPSRHQPIQQPVADAPQPAPQPVVTSMKAPVQSVRLPQASWREVSDPATVAIAQDAMMAAVSRSFPGQLSSLLKTLFVFLAIVIFCVVMTINFKRLRHEKFVPEWLDGEVQLEEIEVSHWWSRVGLRLTNKRILQVRLSWFFSRRKVFGVTLDDIHSVTWRRYTNWLLILIGLGLFGRTNPIALLMLMWGLESKILSISFNTPLAQMPFPRTRAMVTSFRRGQFNELAKFYKKAQLYLAQVRAQKQLPVSSDVKFIPEADKDFFWGLTVWVLVAVWLVVALGQRTLGSHVTLEGFWGALLLGLPVAAAAHSLRSGVWTGILGATALIAAKFPGSIGLLFFASSSDGYMPNLWQCVVLVAAAALIGAVAFWLSRLNPLATFAARLLWLLPIGAMQPSVLADMRTYATCFISIASAAIFSIVAGYAAERDGFLVRSDADAVSRSVAV